MKQPREQMTPAQRRWKWVLFENLPEEMKQFIRPPKIIKDKGKEKPKQTKEAAEVKEQIIEIEEDTKLDYTKMDNVEKILTKYKNQQTSRKNFSVDMHIEVYKMIMTA